MSHVKRANRPLAVLMTTLLLAACAEEDTTGSKPMNFKQIVVFGDSLSDCGTYNPTTFDSDPSNDLPFGLAFTTKPGGTWASYVALRLDLTLTPNQQVNFGVVGSAGKVFELGGSDYAEGGATVRIDPPNGGIVDQIMPGVGTVPVQMATARSVATQISDYLADNSNAFNNSQLVLIQGGANDFFDFLQQVEADPAQATNASTVVGDTATAMVAQIQRLRAAGATHIMYANLPDLGATPKFRGTALETLASQLASDYNSAAQAALNHSGVAVFDTHALISQMIADPASFGFSNVSTPACNSNTTPGDATSLSALVCSNNTLVEAGADQTYLFADGVHPTARAHRIWADKAVEQILGAR